jgi:hypothetical protein
MTAAPQRLKPAPQGLKTITGDLVAGLLDQCRYERAFFVLGHMRCGSTAVSNVLVSRPEVSGYGEAHATYSYPGALGQLVVNQWRRRAWKPGARYLFDKILHDRYDAGAPPAFFEARALFVARAPIEAVLSIRGLFRKLQSAEYATDAAAAAYLAGRMRTLLALHARFAPARRLVLTHETILADPDAALARISRLGGFAPPLENRYRAPARPHGAGAGDPLQSHRFNRIEAGDRASLVAGERRPLELDRSVADELDALYLRFRNLEADGHEEV